MNTFCSTGHGPYPVGTKFCPKCSSNIEKYGMTSAEWARQELRFDEQKRQRRPKNIAIASAWLGGLAVVIAIIVALSTGSDEPSDSAHLPSTADQPADPPAAGPPDCDRNQIDCSTALGEYLAESEGFSGMAADSFVLAYQVCSVFPPEDFVAQGFETGGSTDPVDVAQAYAEETFIASSQQAGFEGCLGAFEGRP